MNSKFLFIIVLLFFGNSLWSQSVWPGDVNNNGIVNKVDLLYLGYAFGATGEARTVTNGDWEAKSVPKNWAFSFPNGLNFLYADCNGDGLVNKLDAQIIEQNVDLVHHDIPLIPDEYIQGVLNENPKCSFLNPPSSAPVNEDFFLEIGLGDDNIPVENLSGLTFTLNIESDFIGLTNTQITFNKDGWLEPDSSRSIILQKIDTLRAEYKIGLSKTDQVPVSGGGSIAKVSFFIEDDIIDLLQIDTITFILDSIRVLDNNLEPIPVVADTLVLKIDRTVNTREIATLPSIQLFPNPNEGFLTIQSPIESMEKIELFNSLGQMLLSRVVLGHSENIDFQDFTSQNYWLKIYTKDKVVVHQVQRL